MHPDVLKGWQAAIDCLQSHIDDLIDPLDHNLQSLQLAIRLLEMERENMGDSKTPCNVCGVLIASDIHNEELGMCVACSNDYFTHDE